MDVSDELKKTYDDYYLDGTVQKKREVSARQTFEHLKALAPGQPHRSVIDIGAGDGAVLAELEANHFGEDLAAVEISESGCASILKRKLTRVRSVEQFDGYHIQAANLQFDLGLVAHVLEHVEHERAFLSEVTRVAKHVYIEVPLELTLRIRRNIVAGQVYGHINHYNPTTFRYLLESNGLEVVAFGVFAASLEYERFIGGSLRGTVKYCLRRTALAIAPGIAPWLFSYIGGAVCRRKPRVVVG